MKPKQFLWGSFFILAAVFIILNQMGFLNTFFPWSLWHLVAMIILLPITITGLINRRFFEFFFGVALLLIILTKPLHIFGLNAWTLLVAALFLSIGFSTLFKPKYHSYSHTDWTHHHTHGYHEHHETVEHIDGNEVNCRTSLGGSSKYVHADSLQRGRFECSLGALKVYFDQATLHPDGATIYVDCALGATELYIPRHWNVIVNVETGIAAVDEQIRTGESRFGPTLTINGSVRLGALEIKYI